MVPDNARWLLDLLKRRTPLDALMRDVLRTLAQSWPKAWSDKPLPQPDWGALQAFDFTGEFERLTKWIDALLSETPPPADINGLFFGLMYPRGDSENRTVAMFVTGSRRYGQDPDWARDTDWAGENCVVVCEVLSTIYQTITAAAVDGIFEREKALWTCLQFTGLVVGEWTCGPLRRKLLGPAASRFIFVGLDPWMGLNIGLLTPQNTP